MVLTIDRKYKKPNYTIGNLYVNDVWFCNTLEDTDRGLTSSMSEFQISGIKIMHYTAIPTGTYIISLDKVSAKFSKYPFYMEVCEGKLPRLLDVKGFTGILIHVAEGPKGADLLSGCIGVGLNKIKGGLLNSKETFKKLYKLLYEAYIKGEQIKIIIK